MAIIQPVMSKYGACLAATETEYGTDQVPVAAGNGLLVWDVSIGAPWQVGSPEYFRPWAGAKHVVSGSHNFEVSFKAPFVGAGEVSEGDVRQPSIGPILKSCKFAEADNTTSFVYTPVTQAMVGCTLYFYFDGADTLSNAYKVTGFQGNAKLVFDPSSMPYAYWEVSGQGLYSAAIEDVAIVSPYSYEATPPAITGALCTLATKVICARKIEIDNAVDIVSGDSLGPATTTGYQYFYGVRKQSTFTLTIDAWLEDSSEGYEWYAALDAGTALAFALGPIGAGAGDGNTHTIATHVSGGLKIESLSEGDAGGVKTYDLTCRPVDSAGDDEWYWKVE